MAKPRGIGKQSQEELAENGRKGAEAREKRSNGWAARREEKDRERIRERIQVGMLVTQLEKASQGEIDLSPTQVSAAKILLDKALPSLQAVEHTEGNSFEQMSEEEILGLVNALITSNPGLIAKLGIGLRPVQDAPEGVKAPQQSASEAA
jgi:hypothetical protein